MKCFILNFEFESLNDICLDFYWPNARVVCVCCGNTMLGNGERWESNGLNLMSSMVFQKKNSHEFLKI